MRSIAPSLSLFVLVFALCLGGAGISACANQRTSTIHSSLVAVNVARDGFVAWDRQHQHEIVKAATTRDEVQRNIADYIVKRAPVVEGFEAAYRALAIAATQSDDTSLAAALRAGAELFEQVKKLRGSMLSPVEAPDVRPQ